MKLFRALEYFAAWIVGALIVFCVAATPQVAFPQRLIDFNASWCGPCQQVAPIVDALRVGGVPIEPIDVSAEAAKARELGYRGESIPLIVGYDASGHEVGRLQGSDQITRAAIERLYATTKAAATPASQPTTNDPDEDVTRIPVYPGWDDARFVKIRDSEPATNGQQATDFTTGAIVEIDGAAVYVVSCAHGSHGVGDAVAILFSTGANACVGDVVAWDYRPTDGVDCSVIKLRCTPRKEFFHIADAEPARGDKLYLGGFPRAGTYRGRFAACLGIDNDLMVDGGAISGESGGPVIDSRGYLCGVIVATDGQSTCCCRLIHLRKLLDACFPNRPGTIVPRADAPPPPVTTGPPRSPLPPPESPSQSTQGSCDVRLGDIEKAIAELRSGKQDNGDYATLAALNEYARLNQLPTIMPPDLSGLATKDDLKETHGVIDKILPAVGKVVDDKLSAIPKSAAIATHVLGVPTSLALPMAVVGGPAGVGLSIAALLAYRKLKRSVAGGRQGNRFCESSYIAGRIGPNDVA